MRLHQILHYNNARISNDLSGCLVFESNNVIRLAHRIKELEQEKGTQREEKKFVFTFLYIICDTKIYNILLLVHKKIIIFREAKMKHAQLIKDRSRMNDKISKMHELCDTRMMQKFGKIVNLEVLESTTVHSQLEEQKEKLRISKENCSVEIEKWNVCKLIRDLSYLLITLITNYFNTNFKLAICRGCQ